MFDATLFTVYAKKDEPFVQPRDIAHVEQRWFCGSHGNVGGGNYSDLAAQVPMHWLMLKAGLHGLAFRREIEVEPGAYSAELYDSFVAADIPDVLQRVVLQHGDRYYRPIDRPPEPRTSTIIHTINESIDKSVFERCRSDANYRPANLTAWATKHGVKLEEIRTSVRADNPSIPVSD